MRKQFGKARGGPARSNSVRNMLRNFAAKNAVERRHVGPEEIARIVRTQVQKDYPMLSPSEVERRVERRVGHGMRPHNAV